MFGTNHFSYLITDESAGATVLGIEDTTGWQAGDEICIASTSQTGSESEKRTILTVDSPTQVTVTSGLTNAHSGTSPTQAEVGNLTRNIRIRGQTSTLQTYVNIAAKAYVILNRTEIYFLGSATSLKRGIDVATTTGNFVISYCSIHDSGVSSSMAINITSASGSNILINNNVIYLGSGLFLTNVATTGIQTINGNLFMLPQGFTSINLTDAGTTFTNNVLVGGNISISEFSNLGEFNNNSIHSFSSTLIFLTNIRTGTINNLILWRCSAGAGSFVLTTSSNLTIENLTCFGNSTANIRIASGNTMPRFVFNNLVSNGDTSFATTSGFQLNDAADIIFNDCDFSTITGIKTAHTNDILINTANSLTRLVFSNCKLGGTNEIGSQSNLATNSYIGSQKHDQIEANHKTIKREGAITIDTTSGLFDVTPSLRLTPSSATEKLTTLGANGGWIFPVASGASITITIKVRKSVAGDGAAYNGNQPRLMLRRNSSLDVTDDTVLATATAASDGAFETLTGTTPIAPDFGVFEFYIDCDGTTGFVNVDSLSG
jgi:hypothetical protein